MPKQPSPPVNMTVEHAKRVNAQFDAEEAQLIEIRNKAQETLSAIQDALAQAYPDSGPNLETLSMAAQTVGYADGAKACSNTQQSQFNAALPQAIKDALKAGQ